MDTSSYLQLLLAPCPGWQTQWTLATQLTRRGSDVPHSQVTVCFLSEATKLLEVEEGVGVVQTALGLQTCEDGPWVVLTNEGNERVLRAL